MITCLDCLQTIEAIYLLYGANCVPVTFYRETDGCLPQRAYNLNFNSGEDIKERGGGE